MRPLLVFPVLCLAAAAGGCGCSADKPGPEPAAAGSNTSPPGPVVPTGPMFDDLDYANWKRFPVGTTVKRKSVTSSESSPVTATSIDTYTLRALTDRHAEVTWQNTTERSDGSARAENPANVRKIARQFPIPKGMTADDFSKPSRKAVPAGDEEVTVLGKVYRTKVYTWADPTEAGPLEVKVWLSDEMPGRIVKQAMWQPNLKSTTKDEVIEVTVPG